MQQVELISIKLELMLKTKVYNSNTNFSKIITKLSWTINKKLKKKKKKRSPNLNLKNINKTNNQNLPFLRVSAEMPNF